MTDTAIKRRQPAQLAQGMPGAAISDKLVGRLAQRFGVPATGLLKTLRDTFFVPPKKDDRPFSNEEMAAALVVCEKYGLNPFAKQIYVSRNRGMLLVIVPIDGWAKIVNEKDDYDGCEFDYQDDKEGEPHSCTCRIYRKGRSRPTEITEFYSECYAPKSDHPSDPWRKWPRRMLRHKAFIQTARIAYALSDVVDDDEYSRHLDQEDYTVRETLPTPEKKTRRRRAPREVVADPVVGSGFVDTNPAEDDSARVDLDGMPVQHLPPDEAPIPEEPKQEDPKAFDKLWDSWCKVRRDLDAPSLAKIRTDSGCELVDKTIGLEKLKKVMELAEEMKI